MGCGLDWISAHGMGNTACSSFCSDNGEVRSHSFDLDIIFVFCSVERVSMTAVRCTPCYVGRRSAEPKACSA